MIEFLIGFQLICTTRQLIQESISTECRQLYYMYHFPKFYLFRLRKSQIASPANNVPLSMAVTYIYVCM